MILIYFKTKKKCKNENKKYNKNTESGREKKRVRGKMSRMGMRNDFRIYTFLCFSTAFTFRLIELTELTFKANFGLMLKCIHFDCTSPFWAHKSFDCGRFFSATTILQNLLQGDPLKLQ